MLYLNVFVTDRFRKNRIEQIRILYLSSSVLKKYNNLEYFGQKMFDLWLHEKKS